MTPEDLPSASVPWCVLRAGERVWRVASADVLEVVPWPRLTPVPLAPPSLLGVCRWNDAIVPVARVEDAPFAEFRCVVMVRVTAGAREVTLGLAAEAVIPAEDADAAELLDLAKVVAALLARPV